MAGLNKVFLMGNLTKDPEVRYTPSGAAVGDLRLAVNRKFRGKDGQDREETCFVGVTVWDRQAETCAKFLCKGRAVLIEGRLKLDEWEKDGQKQSRLGVVAENVQFLGAPRDGEFSDGPAPRDAAKRAEPRAAKPSAPPEPDPESEPDTPVSGAGDEDNLPF